ncbi:MAG: chitobiase/beta-hexosaminidase C-terminal domain-containing protein [Cytophagales bacterium]|nr:chitobiase/beta-hexosaminidase C-terminal domain-containing protein [Cytophagales bacterium]
MKLNLSHKIEFVIPDFVPIRERQESHHRLADLNLRFLYSTGMTLKLRLIGIVFLFGLIPLHAQYTPIGHFQLAPPAIEATQPFFETSSTVSLDLDVEGVELRYALEGEEVTENSPLFKRPITVKISATIKAKAFHRDYQPSEMVSVQVFRITKGKDINVSYSPDPAPQYAGQGAASLFDSRKGSMNFRDGHWLGFSSDTVTFEIRADTSIDQLNLSVLADHGSWIFAPSRIEVWKGETQVGQWKTAPPTAFASKTFQFITIPLENKVQGTIQVNVLMDEIPAWHDGRGTTPWLFIDEIFISN